MLFKKSDKKIFKWISFSTSYHKGPLLCKHLPKPLLACNCAHRSTNAGGLALQHALEGQPCQHGRGWSHQSGGDSTSGHTICDGQGWTTVESQPTKPKEAATQDDERDIGRAHFLLHMPTWSQNSTSNETRHTWADVNHGSTGKVQSSHLANPAARAPNPVAKRGIDQQWPKSQHDAVGTETHAFYQGSRDNGRRNDCKGQLECSKDKGWEAGVTPHLHVQVHPKAVVKVTDESTVFSEGPWKSKDYPSQSHNAHGHDAHHHGVDDVRVSDQAAVEEAKPCCHQEHKCRWGQDPGNCTCVHSIFCQSWVGHCTSYSRQETTTLALWQSNKICCTIFIQSKKCKKRHWPEIKRFYSFPSNLNLQINPVLRCPEYKHEAVISKDELACFHIISWFD